MAERNIQGSTHAIRMPATAHPTPFFRPSSPRSGTTAPLPPGHGLVLLFQGLQLDRGPVCSPAQGAQGLQPGNITRQRPQLLPLLLLPGPSSLIFCRSRPGPFCPLGLIRRHATHRPPYPVLLHGIQPGRQHQATAQVSRPRAGAFPECPLRSKTTPPHPEPVPVPAPRRGGLGGVV